jgi:GGDEF domain-containing protein
VERTKNNLGDEWMKNSEDGNQEETKAQFARILNKDLFLYLLDLEVKRARRYQNFLCLLLLNLRQLPKSNNGRYFQTCQQTLGNLLSREMRETDILGTLGKDKLVALLPYADASAGGYAKSRFEGTLKYFDFKGKGYEVTINQICFPMNGTDTIDLIKKALGAEPS